MAEQKAAQRPRIEPERKQFKSLIAQNPNYFGNLAESSFKAKKKIVGNSKYEEITCVGLNPRMNMLEATVAVKLPHGYGGSLCHDGTTEYVRFYLDYGGGWEDAGVAAFNAHDIPNSFDCAKKKDKPLTYVVTQPIEPRRDFCGRPVLPEVRAILSWEQVPPAGLPNWPPVWGNVLNRHVQIKPRWWLLRDALEVATIKPIEELDLPLDLIEVAEEPIPKPEPTPLSLAKLAELYVQPKTGAKGASKTTVEPHRFGFTDLKFALAPSAVEPQVLESKIAEWKGLGLDWPGSIVLLDKTKGDVSYEELDCLGLDYNREWLTATFQIKRPAGYSGDLCHKGSVEYVAFWVDWDDTCEWDYQGTVEVRVHDIAAIPAEGLHYAAFLPVNLDPFRQHCKEPKIGRIRAVLSWNTPPSTVDPDRLPHWGNRLDAHVEVKPGKAADPLTPKISAIGYIGVPYINVFGNGMTKPNAKFATNFMWADPWDHSRQCPFGGRIIVSGTPVVGYKYRVVRRLASTMTEYNVDKKILTTNSDGVGTWRSQDAFGFFTYLPYEQNIFSVLARWESSLHADEDDLWEIRLDMVDLANNWIASTPWHRVQLDNTRPTVAIDIDGGACDEHTPGDPITGTFVARDLHFGHFKLDTLPLSMSPPKPKTPTAATGISQGNYQTSGLNDPWELDTTGMLPCGYVVRVRVWDRTVVNSSSGHHNSSRDDKGLCLLEED